MSLRKKKVIDGWFNSGTMVPITDVTSIPEVLSIMMSKISEKISKYTKQGSGWIISKLLNFDIRASRYRPLTASSYNPSPEKYHN